MPDTGENQEIRQRVTARESEIVSETTKLVRKEKAELEDALAVPGHDRPKTNRAQINGERRASRTGRRPLSQH
jgi:hypothetical protein